MKGGIANSKPTNDSAQEALFHSAEGGLDASLTICTMICWKLSSIVLKEA